MTTQTRLPGIVRFLYNHNPFYLISAACIVYTLKLAFRPGEVAYIDPWALMGSIAGYTLLMAATGFLVVKLGQVWEDARSIFLVLLLLFLATSVTFDELLNLEPDTGKLLIGCGFGLAVLVTEGLLAGLKIRLRALFRGPYYLWLSLLYFFPLGVSPELTGLPPAATSWRLLGFPVAAGLLTLSLLPAVRRGAAYCRDNGTPWSWPLFPWTLFLFMGIATLFRTYALTISFLPSDGMQTAFQPYFLAPFLFSVLFLLLEMGIVERQEILVRFTLAASFGVLWLSSPGFHLDGTASLFLHEFTGQLGSPLWLAMLAVIALHAWATFRGITVARWSLLGALLIASQMTPRSREIELLSAGQSWPLYFAAGLEFVRGLRRKDVLAFLFGSLCLSLALNITLWNSSWFLYRRTIPYHVALFSVLSIGCLFQNGVGRILRILGAILLPATAAFAVYSSGTSFWMHPGWIGYLMSLVATVGICWFTSRDPAFLYSLLVMLISACVGFITGSLTWVVRQVGAKLLVPLLIGIGSFVVATGISVSKGIQRRRGSPGELDAK